MMPVAQAIGINHFALLQLVPRRGISLQIKEKVYIGEGKRDKMDPIAQFKKEREESISAMGKDHELQKKIPRLDDCCR